MTDDERGATDLISEIEHSETSMLIKHRHVRRCLMNFQANTADWHTNFMHNVYNRAENTLLFRYKKDNFNY